MDSFPPYRKVLLDRYLDKPENTVAIEFPRAPRPRPGDLVLHRCRRADDADRVSYLADARPDR